ncbi:MAG: NAD(P)H-quinone oxidoreductase [Pseudomonadota bacterium]
MSASDEPPETMRAVEITSPGAPDVLKPCTRPTPAPADHEILIHVAVAGVNRPDALQRAGAYPPPPGASDLPGLEVAGTIAAKGKDVTRWKIGDSVCALTAGGGYAEYVTTHADHALPVPAGFDMVQAGALPETCFTVWHNVFERGALQPGETLLVHGGSSGIGTTAIQLAKALGSKVYVTAGSAEKCTSCLALGADRAINYRDEDFVDVVQSETNRRGVDVILDMVGGDYIAKNHRIAAEDGRIVQIAFLKGSKAEIDFTRLMIKRLSHTGSTLRPRTDAVKAGIASELENTVWPLIEDGKFKPLVHKTFPLEDAASAHALMESSAHIGKIVLTV